MSWPKLELEVLIQHPLVKAMLIPIMLAILSVLLEQAPNVAKGRGKGRYKYKIWMHQQDTDSEKTFFSVNRQSLEDVVRMYRRIIDVEQMTTLSISEFSSVAINLIVAAFAVDIAALIDLSREPIEVAALLSFHLILLAAMVISLIISQQAHPDDGKTRRNGTLVAIILSLIAIISAFNVV